MAVDFFRADQLYSEIIDWILGLAETYGVGYDAVLFALERDAEDGRFKLAQALRETTREEG